MKAKADTRKHNTGEKTPWGKGAPHCLGFSAAIFHNTKRRQYHDKNAHRCTHRAGCRERELATGTRNGKGGGGGGAGGEGGGGGRREEWG